MLNQCWWTILTCSQLGLFTQPKSSLLCNKICFICFSKRKEKKQNQNRRAHSSVYMILALFRTWAVSCFGLVRLLSLINHCECCIVKLVHRECCADDLVLDNTLLKQNMPCMTDSDALRILFPLTSTMTKMSLPRWWSTWDLSYNLILRPARIKRREGITSWPGCTFHCKDLDKFVSLQPL